uniref:Uncharacterized protein n=1 Tax=Siphoviridae sp. ctBLh2 TaxID=2827803 RepID=A0A8S5S3F4_9CAUD|nr:MAG TPA: hypothetical protein [Siphoviridae sp. ctBLh2]
MGGFLNNPFYLPLLYGENRKGAKWGIIVK